MHNKTSPNPFWTLLTNCFVYLSTSMPHCLIFFTLFVLFTLSSLLVFFVFAEKLFIIYSLFAVYSIWFMAYSKPLPPPNHPLRATSPFLICAPPLHVGLSKLKLGKCFVLVSLSPSRALGFYVKL